jgi:hypothetical protein
MDLGVITLIPPKEQFEFKFDSPFPGHNSFAYLSFYTIDEEKLVLKILDLEDNQFIYKKKFETEYLGKLHFRRKQNFIIVIVNPNKNKRLRVMIEFHCINCKDKQALGDIQAKKGKH